MAGASRIQILSDHVANKIAAGEVVDRPASVLKELMENALDAGATDLDVEIVEGGRKALVVTDNGCGMNRQDALLSVERHATSKIRDVDDIERISTLGFRGEALAAIAAVSRFALTTRSRDSDSGTELNMIGGKLQDVRDAGCPAGTSVAVRNLFFNVPARKKFLRTDQTEAAHVRHTFLVYAVSHPHVGMCLRVDGQEAYRLPPDSSLEDRIRDLFGLDLVRALRPISHRQPGVDISGFASTPQITRGDKNDQYLFINRRPAAAALLSYAVQEGYGSMVIKGRYPVVFLFLQMEPTLVDVNVHPTKREVRFRQPILVRDSVIESIREALARKVTGTSDTPSLPGSPPAPPERLAESLLEITDLPALKAFSYPRIPLTREPSAGAAADDAPVRPAEARATPAAPWTWCRVLGQIGGLYVILETDEGMVLMDPHAAHERVIYERLLKSAGETEAPSQGLLVPDTVELGPRDAAVVRDQLGLLKQMGFGVAEFGKDAFVVDALPACLGGANSSAVLSEVATALERSGAPRGAGRWEREAIAQAASRAAVHARDRLSLREVEELVVELAKTEMPYTCPHGRPTVISMSFQDLNRKFGRQ